MAIVTALQFNDNSGAMICDEEYWFLRRRRSFFLDNIRNLIPEEYADFLGIEAAYGGWGHPGFHEEVIRRSREKISRIITSNKHRKKGGQRLADLEDIAGVVREAMQETRRRKVDDMLKFLYGFTVDDLNQGFWMENDKKYEIKQDAVLKAAKGIASFQTKNHLTNPIFKNKAVVIGFDPVHRFRAFHINAENTVTSLISGGFEAIGAGKYGAGIEFSRIMNRLTLDQRRSGFDRVWALIALMEATLKAYDYFHEVGGGLNLVYINGEGKKHQEKYFEFSDAPMHLAMEMVKAKEYGLLPDKALYTLMDDVLFKNKPVKTVESAFFNAVSDDITLRKLLRGYKFPPFPVTNSTKTKKKRATKVKGR